METWHGVRVMSLDTMCEKCNNFLMEFNAAFTLHPFWFEVYRMKNCSKKIIGLDDNTMNCLEVYGKKLLYFTAFKSGLSDEIEIREKKTCKRLIKL